MSGRITIDSLSDSLKEVILNSGLSEEEITTLIQNAVANLDDTYATKDDIANIKPVDISGKQNITDNNLATTNKTIVGAINEVKNSIDNKDLSVKQDTTDNNLATTNKTIVGAINELFQNANNGKQLIASAIGEPLDSNDTFSAMSTDINNLLSTFKTNMINNGVTVESSDKFKALIDKIATIDKGMQISTGHFDITTLQPASEGGGFLTSNKLNFNPPLNFMPDRVILSIPNLQLGTRVGGEHAHYSIDSEIHSAANHRFITYDENGNEITMYISTVINDITAEGVVLSAGKDTKAYALTTPEGIDWLAIGE